MCNCCSFFTAQNVLQTVSLDVNFEVLFYFIRKRMDLMEKMLVKVSIYVKFDCQNLRFVFHY